MVLSIQHAGTVILHNLYCLFNTLVLCGKNKIINLNGLHFQNIFFDVMELLDYLINRSIYWLIYK